MIVAVWIVSALLALVYLAGGGLKVVLPPDRLHQRFPFSQVLGSPVTRTIGVLEVLGAIGLILPVLTDIAPVLAPIAAIGLALVQIGAAAYHATHKEVRALPTNVVLFAMAVFVAIARLAFR